MQITEKRLAIIPARSGSKGLRDKNIKLLNNQPLMAYSINAAIESNIFDEIHVSTDSQQYADIAVKYGANVPFLRDEVSSKDNSSTWDVARYVIKQYKKINKYFQSFIILQPTSPLRTVKDILNAYDIFYKKKANVVVSVCEVDQCPLCYNTLPEDNSLCNFLDKKIADLPRQDFEVYYKFNGSIFIVKEEYFNRTIIEDMYSTRSYAYIMPKERSLDIDDEFDFRIAMSLLN